MEGVISVFRSTTKKKVVVVLVFSNLSILRVIYIFKMLLLFCGTGISLDAF